MYLIWYSTFVSHYMNSFFIRWTTLIMIALQIFIISIDSEWDEKKWRKRGKIKIVTGKILDTWLSYILYIYIVFSCLNQFLIVLWFRDACSITNSSMSRIVARAHLNLNICRHHDAFMNCKLWTMSWQEKKTEVTYEFRLINVNKC